MPSKFRLSVRAEKDVLEIGFYTLTKWGERQTKRYLDGLESCLIELAENPRLGKSCNEVRLGLHRLEHGRHVVFYRRDTAGILISRVLHQRMLPKKHL